jgi:hypothetical protein
VRASLLVVLVALLPVGAIGCRCEEAKQPPGELLALVPPDAALVGALDFEALRQAPALTPLWRSGSLEDYQQLLGFDPSQDLQQVLLAAASATPATRRGRAGSEGISFLVLLRGEMDRDTVLAALKRRGYDLEASRRGGHTFYSEPAGHGTSLVFPGAGVMAGVSRSWTGPLLERLRGRGRRLLDVNAALAPEIRVVRREHGGWVVSQIAPALAELLARRAGWDELRELRSLRATLAASHRIEIGGALTLASQDAASSLRRRLDRLVQVLKRGAAPLVAGLVQQLQLRRDTREVRATLTFTGAQLRELLPASK